MIKQILFNTDMVRSILDGKKTMTRRLIKQNTYEILNSPYHKEHPEVGDKTIIQKLCNKPYHPGNILYVRETWSKVENVNRTPFYIYKADYGATYAEYNNGFKRWYPSIHMPKEAARIFLKVKDVRVERLQEITDEQAESEGCNDYSSTANGFCYIWDSTIKKRDIGIYGWDANPWVWVIEFEQCERPEEFYQC